MAGKAERFEEINRISPEIWLIGKNPQDSGRNGPHVPSPVTPACHYDQDDHIYQVVPRLAARERSQTFSQINGYRRLLHLTPLHMRADKPHPVASAPSIIVMDHLVTRSLALALTWTSSLKSRIAPCVHAYSLASSSFVSHFSSPAHFQAYELASFHATIQLDHHRGRPRAVKAIGFSADTITPSKSIKYPEAIISNGSKFQLGFFSPASSTDLYVGIWYNGIDPVKGIIWVANRQTPLKDSSGSLMISEDGNLVVVNGQKEVLWSSNVEKLTGNNTIAKLLDLGNLVLQDKTTGMNMWESFQQPSNVFVPAMKLGVNLRTGEKIQLTSWKSPSDPSVGNFSVGFEPFDIPQVFVWKNSQPYWRSGQWNGRVFVGMPNMNYSYLYGFSLETDKEEETFYVSYALDTDKYLLDLFMGPEGISIERFWNWTDYWEDYRIVWSNPQNECDVYGKCGPFGSCDSQKPTICSCLRGGYMSPEYAMVGLFSEKSNVFSYGVLLLEIVSGRRNTSFGNDEDTSSLLEYAWKLWNEDNVLEMVDKLVCDPCHCREILRCIHVGLLCVQEMAKDRPTMSTVISMLNSEIVDLPSPKQPAFILKQNAKNAGSSSQHGQQRCSINNVTVTIVQGR
ncbi:hypothetical protein SLEP1_g29448 [Rubroshorea leprosula]|uniref:Bulb-type lectin domain-containing protein n=1 Tax=Rubroshorea leprosula TaxID=152421 RepID=A0AAV5K7L1_9ROSI|nr:hypothetical protein SLEP1_g29448 [Rubroshorea leprosula]